MAQWPKLTTTGFLKASLGGPVSTTGLRRVWLSASLGRSRPPSGITARKISSGKSTAPSGTVRDTPWPGRATAYSLLLQSSLKLDYFFGGFHDKTECTQTVLTAAISIFPPCTTVWGDGGECERVGVQVVDGPRGGAERVDRVAVVVPEVGWRHQGGRSRRGRVRTARGVWNRKHIISTMFTSPWLFSQRAPLTRSD